MVLTDCEYRVLKDGRIAIILPRVKFPTAPPRDRSMDITVKHIDGRGLILKIENNEIPISDLPVLEKRD